MLILMDTSLQENRAPERPTTFRKEYFGVAAVVLAIIVSLAGVCVVIVVTSSDGPRAARLVLAAE